MSNTYIWSAHYFYTLLPSVKYFSKNYDPMSLACPYCQKFQGQPIFVTGAYMWGLDTYNLSIFSNVYVLPITFSLVPCSFQHLLKMNSILLLRQWSVMSWDAFYAHISYFCSPGCGCKKLLHVLTINTCQQLITENVFALVQLCTLILLVA